MNALGPIPSPVQAVTPQLASLWLETAGLLGATPEAAREAAERGAVEVGGVLIAMFDLNGAGILGGNDLAVVGELEGVCVRTIGDARMLLHANMVLGFSSGLSFSASAAGDLHAHFTARQADTTAAALADRIADMVSVIAAFKEGLSGVDGPMPRVRTGAVTVPT